jgi:hypothetical protein
MCGVSGMGRFRKEEVTRRCGSEPSIGERMGRNVLRWYGNVNRMGVVKRVYVAKMENSR